mgnify:CR=1 FL=1
MPSLEIIQNFDNAGLKMLPLVLEHIFTDKLIDMDELNNYVSVIINMEQIENGTRTYHKHPMKICDPDEFNKIGITEGFSNVKYRICPNITNEEDYYKVKNSFVNMVNRNSFSI